MSSFCCMCKFEALCHGKGPNIALQSISIFGNNGTQQNEFNKNSKDQTGVKTIIEGQHYVDLGQLSKEYKVCVGV